MKKTFTFIICLLSLLHAGDSWMEEPFRELNIIERYRPHLNHYFQKSYEYGIYEEKEEVTCLKNKNISAIIDDFDYFVTADNELFRLHFINQELNCKREITVDDLQTIKTIKMIPYSGKLDLLVSDSKVINDTTEILVYKVKSSFEKIGKMSFDEYWKKYHFNSQYRQYYLTYFDTKNSNHKNKVHAIVNKPNKQFMVGYEDRKFLTTHLKNTPNYVLYYLPEDLFLIAFDDHTGFHIFENIHTKNYTKVQNTVKDFLNKIITPWWKKPDLNKINIDNGKLERFIELFSPYEIDQHHQIRYKVVAYKNNTSDVQIVVDKKHTIMIKLAKNDDWKVEDLEFK